MANAILNFHFDFLKPSLRYIQKGFLTFFARYSLIFIGQGVVLFHMISFEEIVIADCAMEGFLSYVIVLNVTLQ